MRFIYSKKFSVFFSVMFGCVFFLFLQYRGWSDPIKKVVLSAPTPIVYLTKTISQPFFGFFRTIFNLKKIASENIRYENEKFKLQEKLVELNFLKLENETLRKELGFYKTNKKDLVLCKVLSRDTFDISGSITLDCGEDKKISAGSSVTSQGYLAGKIVHVGKVTSTAIIATSPKYSIDAKILENGKAVLAVGSFGSGMLLKQIPMNTEIKQGDIVVSAGINDKTPANILIGEIGQEIVEKNSLFKKSTLVSPVNFSSLEFVYVYINQ